MSQTDTELARKTAEVRILQRVSADINSTLDLDEICDVALRTMDELFEFHHAIILLLEPDNTTLKVVASRGYENQAVGGRVQVGTGVIGMVARKRQMMHVNNLGQQRAYVAAQRREMEKSGRHAQLGEATPVPGLPNAESQIAIPLLIRGDLIGVFSIESPVPRSFGEHDRDLVSIISNQIASAIHNARLYEQRRLAAAALQEANASLEARVAERTAALERELRVAQALLNEARTRVDGPLLGGSPAVRGLRDAIARQARSIEPLLLTGPAGAGKEAVARAVHDASGRSGAFIFVSCAEVTTQYRHGGEANAPDDADESLLGSRFELASGGTIFLDAVHELPPALQDGLHLTIERERSRLSRGESGVPDVRLIASTTHDLRQPPPGAFPPLFQALGANRVSVPPLVDRREDIPTLVDHFVRRHARRFGKVIDDVSPDSMRRLEAYTWPGNIRELGTVLERAVLVCKSTILEVDAEQLNEALAVGSYRLVSPLGSGGMGEIWLARHRFLVRPAAVKLIRHDVAPGAARDQLVRRFEREAHVTAGLRSPHTVQLYDFGVNESGSFYYVMEYLDGLDLQRLVTRFGPQPAERVIMLLRQACRSLAEAHERGLVHRDIKPANVFVTRLGTEYDYVKVLDFGVVKEQAGQQATMITHAGVVQGTPAFMPPEIVMGETRIDGRADLYSLACTAYWVLTAQTLFEGNTPAQVLLQHVQAQPVPPSTRSELSIPKSFEAILMMCLEKDPAKRPSSARQLDAQLAQVAREAPWTNERAQQWWESHAPEAVGSN
jgi:DNA-binding NtrC family response regulator/putative methionine-R-sulfoxide reductase with GAF domain/plasmid stabilization system protein ParE